MEPAKATIRYNIHSTVKEITKEPEGYFVWLEGSMESICLGQDEPDMKVGDRVLITIQRLEIEK